MKPLNVIRAVKAKKEDELLALEGVTGVDIGPKIVKGERTAEKAIRVYVEEKKKTVPKNQAIPPTIEGVKTDVIEAKFVLHHRVAVEEVKPHVDTGTYSPLVGGISIGPCTAVGGFVYVGTLGCMVKDRSSGDSYMLSNYHVMAEKWAAGESQCQPSRVDGGSCPSDVVGTLVRSVISENVDGAVASITNRSYECSIHEIGNVRGKNTAAEEMKVRKRGRTTELTHGIVDSIDASVNVPYDDGVHTLKNQIIINVDSSQSTEFGLGGDSGSAVVDENDRVVGLYFAGTEDGSIGVANPIDAVLNELDVDLCTVPFYKDIRSEIFEKIWWREGFYWKDRFKEVAYDKPPFSEYYQNPWDRVINPPIYDRPWFDRFGSIEERIRRLEQVLRSHPGGAGVSPSAPGQRCAEFGRMRPGTRSNPFTEEGAKFEVFDFNGTPASNARITDMGGGSIGLDAGFRTVVTHAPCDFVEVTLMHFHPSAAMAEAFNAAGTVVDRAAMTVGQGVDETLTLRGGGIVRVEISSPQDEVLLRRYCHCGLIKIPKPEKLEKREIKEWKEFKDKPEPKELKEKPEPKELKDGKEKPEPKELKEKEWKEKPEPKELKEKPEPKELKDGKEKPEPKELKEKEQKEKPEPKELKEKEQKEKPEPKELQEGGDPKSLAEGGDPKTLVEGGGPKTPLEGPPRPFGSQGGAASLEARLAALEAKIGSPHFIGQQLRPDLSHGALKYE